MGCIELIFYDEDPAALNIASMLQDEGFDRFKTKAVDKNILYSEGIFEQGKTYIVLSKHKSEKQVRAITCHHTGNWTEEAKYGGKPFSTSISIPNILKGIFMQMLDEIENAPGFAATLEVTHHGPTPNIPIMFLEIGSSRKDWVDENAAKIICSALQEFEPCEEGEVVMGVGGPHYAPNFTRLLDKYRIGHIIPKYAIDGLSYEAFCNGIENCQQKTEKILMDWKGMSAQHREKIAGFCNKYGIEYVKYK